MDVYAAGSDDADPHFKIGVLVAGIGQSASGSDDAVRSLPTAVSFAFSPYAISPDPLLGEIRAKGHEFLLSVPMEPQGYPSNDEGAQELLVGASAPQNARRLDWTLSRIAGYAGVTNALDGMRGERFTASATQFRPWLEQMAGRGLLFVDASPETDAVPFAAVPHLAARRVDVVLDTPAVRSEID
ncbi:MAG: divergent polysaccharide deacetylase family protein, partial [Acetobacteraceae bacterium]|nr:divergent polysaccharide deacetylase family protein [Acetobacteraceae bacterium]